MTVFSPEIQSLPLTEPTEQIETDRTYRTEEQKNGETEETEVTQDCALVAFVQSVQDAVKISLKKRIGRDTLFIYARALKAMEARTGCRIMPEEWPGLFRDWWASALSKLLDNADYNLYLAKFTYCMHKAKIPLGVNPLESALEYCDSQEPNSDYGPTLGRLLMACERLNELTQDGVFFLSARDAKKLAGVKNNYDAAALLFELERRGDIQLVQLGAGTRASRYRFTKGKK